jgi:preprotein translocase subunit SecG
MYGLMVFLTVVYVIACLFLVFVVLIQKGEGGGLGGAFGGGAVDVAFGAKADMTWKRATAVCATIFMTLAMVLGVMHHQMDKRSLAAEQAAEAARKRAAEQAEKASTETKAPGPLENPGVGPGVGPGGISPVQTPN